MYIYIYTYIFVYIVHIQARDLLERLTAYLHADGAGLPHALLLQTSEALSRTIAATLA